MGVARPSRHGRGAEEEALLKNWYQQHGAAILAFATGLTGDPAIAEDVLQETLVRAWRHASSLSESIGSVRSWLFTVARNIITDHLRAKSVRPKEVAQLPETAPAEHDHAQRVVDSIVALQALERLSREHRIVLEELYFRGRSVAEAAVSLGIPPGTVKSRAHYALKALRDNLSQAARERTNG
jgi:RNA polymerase sigma-70 factor (ECF subfamily)